MAKRPHAASIRPAFRTLIEMLAARAREVPSRVAFTFEEEGVVHIVAEVSH